MTCTEFETPSLEIRHCYPNSQKFSPVSGDANARVDCSLTYTPRGPILAGTVPSLMVVRSVCLHVAHLGVGRESGTLPTFELELRILYLSGYVPVSLYHLLLLILLQILSPRTMLSPATLSPQIRLNTWRLCHSRRRDFIAMSPDGINRIALTVLHRLVDSNS